ncbi:MAG: NusG domain II-containing protein [Chitinispirillaceae bacterium]|nr:NusG domain II-containing protein [Chitinispirillaceae bacterium]
MRSRVAVKLFDIVLIAGVLAATGALAFFVYGKTGAPESVRIQGGTREWFYPLDRDREIEVPGPLGITRVRIEHGTVFVLDSPCPEKTCMKAGRIRDRGGWIACLPNQVFIAIEGTPAIGYDAESY